MKRVALIIALLVAVLAGAGWWFRDTIGFVMFAWSVTPNHPFNAAEVPPAPKYEDNASWAALPGKHDLADYVPGDAQDNQARAQVDVFYVYPTTYIGNEHWNQGISDAVANKDTDDLVLDGEASAFNGCCRVYAPRYRQAGLSAFLDKKGNGEKALAIAYQDVEAAFDYFILHFNQGRPFIVAGHSQGTRHLQLLLQRRIAGTPLLERMVAAYLIGFNVDRNVMAKTVPNIPVCSEAKSLGCYVTWNSAGPKAGYFGYTPTTVCVNPLTWRADGARADFALNLGSLSTTNAVTLKPGAADAQCIEGRLRVSALRTDQFKKVPMLLGRDNYHVLDYLLFYMNLRQNAQARSIAWLTLHNPTAVEVKPALKPDDAANFVPGHY